MKLRPGFVLFGALISALGIWLLLTFSQEKYYVPEDGSDYDAMIDFVQRTTPFTGYAMTPEVLRRKLADEGFEFARSDEFDGYVYSRWTNPPGADMNDPGVIAVEFGICPGEPERLSDLKFLIENMTEEQSRGYYSLVQSIDGLIADFETERNPKGEKVTQMRVKAPSYVRNYTKIGSESAVSHLFFIGADFDLKERGSQEKIEISYSLYC